MTSARIADLNDAFRNGGFASGQWVMTRGIATKGPDFLAAAVRQVRGFDAFSGDNDPYGEHDFGSFDLAGEKLFWKIDCYDAELAYGSPDPADPANPACSDPHAGLGILRPAMSDEHYTTVEEITWRGIRIRVRWAPEWLGMRRDSDYAISHLEILSIAPEGTPLPMTGTGYRSHFIHPGLIEQAGGPVAYVQLWLDQEANSAEWRAKEAAARQLDLF